MPKQPKIAMSLSDQAHRQLEELIVTLDLKPGSVWTEQTLSEVVKIGRTPVREAIKRLEADRLIVTVPRHGIRISDINLHEQLQVVEFRTHLEILLSGWAARRALPEEREKLVEMAMAFEKTVEPKAIVSYLRAVSAANQFVAQCARNPFAAKSVMPLFGLSRRFYYRYHQDLHDIAEVSRLHAARARAVASGDGAAAEKAATELMQYIEGYTRAIFMRDVGRI